MADDEDASRSTLDSISAQIARSLGAVADELLRESAATSLMLRRYEHERSRVREFIDHFAVGSLVADHAIDRGDPEFQGTQVNHRVIRRDLDALDESIARGQQLQGRLMASQRVLRELRSSFEDASGEIAADSIGNVRLQQATLAAREQERGRLAREVHDGPAQVLANAIFAIELAEQVARREPERVLDELSRLRALLRDGLTEVRRFMADLRPAMLTDRGLVPSLRHYVDEYNRFFDMRVTFTATDVPATLGSEQQLALFRIVQEALQNLHKHAGTRSGAISIAPDRLGEMLILTVVDEGNGFDPDSAAIHASDGAGLTGIRERARLIGADLDLRSAPGAGTAIRLALPLPVHQPVTPAEGPTNGRSS